jgi:hypothetical protein
VSDTTVLAEYGAGHQANVGSANLKRAVDQLCSRGANAVVPRALGIDAYREMDHGDLVQACMRRDEAIKRVKAELRLALRSNDALEHRLAVVPAIEANQDLLLAVNRVPH